MQLLARAISPSDTLKPTSTRRPGPTRPGPSKQFRLGSPRLEPNLHAVLPLLPRVLRLRFPHLVNLRLQQRLRQHPVRRNRIHTPRLNRIDANVQDVPATETA